MDLFWSRSEGRLRALWRLLAQAAIMLVLGATPILLIAEPLTALHRRGMFLSGYNHDDYDRIINMIVGPVMTAGVIFSVVIARKWLDHRPVESLGVRFDRAWWRGLIVGLALGTGFMTLVFVAEYATGSITVTGVLVANATGISVGLAFAFSAVKVLCVGVYEEFVSRGYQLRNLADGLTLPWGIVASSAVFALLHLTNDNSGALSTIGLFVNGLLLATALLVTRRLSTSIGLHIAWNFAQGVLFGFPVSGDKEGASLIGIHQGGATLFTGGDFGPEAGLVGILASLTGIGVLLMFAGGCTLNEKRGAP